MTLKDQTRRSDDRACVQQSAEWLETTNDTARDRRAFANWLLESRRNVREYLLLTAFDQELRKIDPQRLHDVDALLQDTSAEVVSLEDTQPVRERRGTDTRRVSYGWAATFVVALVGTLLTLAWNAGSHGYRTALGEQRTFKLPDGSIVHLNTKSHVELHFTPGARDVSLAEGEALFVVAKDAARPFRVTAGNAVIQAVGTQFNVRHFDADTRVSVVEGKVQVAGRSAPNELASSGSSGATLLEAGEEILIAGNGHVAPRSTPDLARALAWRERRLVFRNDSLASVAAELNRYNSVQIQVEGEDVRQRRFTGVLDADDPQALLRVLAVEGDLEVEQRKTDYVVRRAR